MAGPLGSALFVAYLAVAALLALEGLYYLAAVARVLPVRATAAPPALVPTPHVTIQVPVRNERAALRRCLDALARLDWPRDRLDVQVIDDSDDANAAREIAANVERLRASGLDVAHFPGAPEDAKAGALRIGLANARGDVLALFDADFEPPPAFLRSACAHLADERVACVQARWTSANEADTWFTRAVALGLDAHFAVEQESRARQGSLLSFSGTAAVWRRAAIEECGGWSGATLAEDVDLSTRALLAGWRFVHLDALRVPQEAPATMRAFRAQQARWARGSMQCARLHAARVARSRLRPGVRAETLFHLTHYAVHPLLLALFLLQLASPWTPAAPAWVVALTLTPAVLAPLALFTLAAARSGGLRRLAHLPALALVGLGLSWSNTKAVALGLFARRGRFVRTPKRGEPRARRDVPRLAELALGAVGVAAGALLFPAWPALVCLVFGAGFLLVALMP